MRYRLVRLTSLVLSAVTAIACQEIAALPTGFTPGNILVPKSPSGAQDLFEHTTAGRWFSRFPSRLAREEPILRSIATVAHTSLTPQRSFPTIQRWIALRRKHSRDGAMWGTSATAVSPPWADISMPQTWRPPEPARLKEWFASTWTAVRRCALRLT
jgi:hypothetical protein